jgi:pilus assembly protein Flp/PilA
MRYEAALRLWLYTRRVPGQGMVEYGLILAAVALVVIVALFAIGPKVSDMFSSAGTSLK